MRTYHEDPDTPAVYLAASKIPKSFNAIIAPHIPTTARIPPPDPITAMFGTYSFNC